MVGLAGWSKRTSPAAADPAPAATRMAPWVPASDEPKPSVTMTWGRVAKIRSRVAADIAAPPLEKEYSDEASWAPAARSQASSSGRATASPTTVSMLTCSAATVRHTASGSSDPSISTTFDPANSQDHEVHWAAACIIGASGR
jgi:hypothetical protein